MHVGADPVGMNACVKGSNRLGAICEFGFGAGDGLRTRYLDLGKVALYQVSYSRSVRKR